MSDASTDIFAALRQATARAEAENDLPDFLAARLYRIAAAPDVFRDQAAAIIDLTCQVADYDTYAQTGYMGMGVNNAILEGAIWRILKAAGERAHR